MKIDLTDTTFIIPVRIDSRDREFNFEFVIEYLIENFKTNIIIWESSDRQDVEKILKRICGPMVDYYHLLETCVNWVDGINIKKDGVSIIYYFERTDSPIFHRTRILNDMLYYSKTPVVVNYDCDVFMLPEAYVEARNAVLAGADLVYPYFEGESQVKVEVCDRDFLHKPQFLLDCAKNKVNDRLWGSRYGHVQFFNREAYIAGGMENENFLSYGAEDSERFFRFQKLGYKVERLGNYIFHLEHARGHNSSNSNPHFKHNDDLFREMMYLSADQLRGYYINVQYLKKYRK